MSEIVYFKTTPPLPLRIKFLLTIWLLILKALKNSLICLFFRVDSEYDLICQIQWRRKQLDSFYKLQFDIMVCFFAQMVSPSAINLQLIYN
jgi:hypothetical protein